MNDTEARAQFDDWAEDLMDLAWDMAAMIGDVTPAMHADVAIAYVIVNNGFVWDLFDEQEQADAEQMLDDYECVVDIALADLMEAGWIDAEPCSDNCGCVVVGPAYPCTCHEAIAS